MRLDRELTCAEVVEVVTDYLENRMSTDDRERFEEHLAFCDGCSVYFEQMKLTIAATGRLRPEDVPSALEDRLLTAFRAWRPA
jgi:predicted anti-sigma-YlaC factor YlaD